MPGTYIFKPIEANLIHKTHYFHKMNSYCSFQVGDHKIKGPLCENGGKHPHWHDSVTVSVTKELNVLVKLMDDEKVSHHSHDGGIGSCIVDLNEIESLGRITKWYPLYSKNKKAGEILLETSFQPEGTLDTSVSNVCEKTLYGDESKSELYGNFFLQDKIISNQSDVMQPQEQIITQPVFEEKAIADHATVAVTQQQQQQSQPNSTIFVEQRQVVKPHSFFKEVEVVETRPVMQEIEVLKPVKVMKDVEVTKVVPVKKQIQVCEPYVVTKEVEVIEPHLVTKTIQVIENVPVMREINVVEMKNTIKEVETIESKTFTKQMQITELMPAKKEFEVSQPVTVKKAVEFVEPVITTQIITKEVREPVIVDQEVITSVGPASVVGMTGEYRENVYVRDENGQNKMQNILYNSHSS